MSYRINDEAKERFVQFRPSYSFNGRGNGIEASSNDQILWCDDSMCSDGTEDGKSPRYGGVDLQQIKLKPTHYALQYSSCQGMNVWNLQASVDAKHWDTLHEVRGKGATLGAPKEGVCQNAREELPDNNCICGDIGDYSLHKATCPTSEYATLLAEAHRQTWALDPLPNKFYRYFRISGLGTDERYTIEGEEGDAGREACTCLHGCALELYGDVHEE